jgi:hypothetical protein
MNWLKLTLITFLLCAFGYFLIAITPLSQPMFKQHKDLAKPLKISNTEENIDTSGDQHKPPAFEKMKKSINLPGKMQSPPYIPPITKSKNTQNYSGDLEDHEAYKQYHVNQKRELKMAFINASKQKIVRLEMLIARGIREGLSQEKIEFAKEKVSGLKAMSEQLENELNPPH